MFRERWQNRCLSGLLSHASPLLSYRSLHGENAVSHQLIGKPPAHCEICSEFQQIDIFPSGSSLSCFRATSVPDQSVSAEGRGDATASVFLRRTCDFGENVPRQRRSTFSTVLEIHCALLKIHQRFRLTGETDVKSRRQSTFPLYLNLTAVLSLEGWSQI